MFSGCDSDTGNDTELHPEAGRGCSCYFLGWTMDVETISDLYSKVIPRDTRAGGLDRVVNHGGNIIRPLFVFCALFTNLCHDDSGPYIQRSGI